MPTTGAPPKAPAAPSPTNPHPLSNNSIIFAKIISDVTINERQDIYTCLKLYTNIFMEAINDLQEAQNSSLITNQYFGLIKKFLTLNINIIIFI